MFSVEVIAREAVDWCVNVVLSQSYGGAVAGLYIYVCVCMCVC